MCFPIVLVVFVGGMQHVVDDVLPTVDGNPFRGGAEYDLNAVNAFVSPYLYERGALHTHRETVVVHDHALTRAFQRSV